MQLRKTSSRTTHAASEMKFHATYGPVFSGGWLAVLVTFWIQRLMASFPEKDSFVPKYARPRRYE